MRRPLLVAVLVVASGLLVAVSASGGAVPRPPSSGPPASVSTGFTPIDPHESISGLESVSCPTATFCMAVGFFQDGNSQEPLAERFDGTTWTNAKAVLFPDATGVLESVSCTSSSFCMAVGEGSGGAIAQDWNGHSWSVVGTDSHASDSELHGVSCPADNLCAAVGEDAGTSAFQAMVQYWQGGSFTLGTAAQEPSAVNVLYSVSCPDTAACMAVGTYQNIGTGDTGVLTELDVFGVWTLEPATGTKPTATNDLFGVSCTGFSACMAVGVANNEGQRRALSYSWDGSAWTRVSTPQPGTAVDNLSAVTCRGSDDASCVAVGDENNEPITSDHPDVFDWNGARWSTDAVPANVAPFESLSGVSCSSTSRCAAVGTESDDITSVAFAVSRASHAWIDDGVPDPRQLSEILDAVSCVSSARCVAVGSYNGPTTPYAEVWNGSAWKIEDPKAIGQSATLDAVSCPAKNRCVAVGQVDLDRFSGLGPPRPLGVESGMQGLVETWNGSRWSAKTLTNSIAASESLTAVWCLGLSFCLAVGTEDGLIPDSWVWNGKSWSEVGMPATGGNDYPDAVRCRTTTECVAAGSGSGDASGFAETWNGKRWSITPVPGSSYPYFVFNGLACPATNRCFAVGSQDLVYDQKYNIIESWNGTKWSVVSSPNPTGYYGGLASVFCAGPNTCLASGPAFDQSATTGLVLRWNGTAWSTVTLPTSAQGEVNLLGVDTLSGSAAVVVGWKFEGFGFHPFTLIESGGHWRAS